MSMEPRSCYHRASRTGAAVAVMVFVALVSLSSSRAPEASQGGGAVGMENGSNIIIRDCIFENNQVFNRGGAICSFNSDLNLENCTFMNNSGVSNQGGAIYFEELAEQNRFVVQFCAHMVPKK